jgi:hypothetical protein
MLHISFGLKLGKQFTSYYFWLAEHPCEPFTLSILSVLFSLFGESHTRDYDIEHNDYDIEHNDYWPNAKKIIYKTNYTEELLSTMNLTKNQG